MQVTLSQAIEGYFIAAHARRLSHHTLRNYDIAFRRFETWLGHDPPLDTITPDHIRRFLGTFPHLAAKTVLGYHTGLSALWTWACKESLVPRNIVRDVQPPRPPCALVVTSRRYDLPLPRGSVRALDVLEPAQSEELLGTLLSAEWLGAEPGTVGQIAELLEHIPLALALAARRVERIGRRGDGSAGRPLAALLEELRERRMQVLNQGEDPERPDLSVVITFDASYEDLDEPDRARLRRMGVFARNDLYLPALQVVWDDDEAAARQALERLANAGLVEERGRDAWWLHDLLREYAGERLARAGTEEEEAARLAHAAYWHEYLENLELRGVEGWQDLEACRPEVEQAARWLLGDWERAPKLAAEMAVEISQSFEWYRLTHWEEWVRSGQAAADASGERNLARILQRSLGTYLLRRGEVAQARDLLEASLETARELLEVAKTEEEAEAGQFGVAVTLGDIARLKAQGGDVSGALELHEQELEVYEQLGDVRSRAVTLYDLAGLRWGQGEYEEAERLYRASREISRQIGDIEGALAVLAQLGVMALEQGRPEEAVPLLQEARQGFEEMGFGPWVAHIDGLLAQVQGRALSLEDLLALIRSARQGDRQAGEQAWHICLDLAGAQDEATADLGRALQRVLSGVPPETALEGLPDELRGRILEGLDEQQAFHQ